MMTARLKRRNTRSTATASSQSSKRAGGDVTAQVMSSNNPRPEKKPCTSRQLQSTNKLPLPRLCCSAELRASSVCNGLIETRQRRSISARGLRVTFDLGRGHAARELPAKRSATDKANRELTPSSDSSAAEFPQQRHGQQSESQRVCEFQIRLCATRQTAGD